MALPTFISAATFLAKHSAPKDGEKALPGLLVIPANEVSRSNTETYIPVERLLPESEMKGILVIQPNRPDIYFTNNQAHASVVS